MAATRNPLLAQLKKTFAESHGCDERTARRHFNRNSEDWQAFIAKQGREAAELIGKAKACTEGQAVALQVLSPQGVMEKPAVADEVEERLAEPERILKTQWEVYQQASAAWRKAMTDGNAIEAHMFGQATIKAQEAYYKAKARHAQWELDERQKIPAQEFHAFRAVFLLPLANLIRNLPAHLGPLMNPGDKAYAIRAGQEYIVGTFDPQLSRLISELDAHVPAAA